MLRVVVLITILVDLPTLWQPSQMFIGVLLMVCSPAEMSTFSVQLPDLHRQKIIVNDLVTLIHVSPKS